MKIIIKREPVKNRKPIFSVVLIVTGSILVIWLAIRWFMAVPTVQERRASQIVNSFMESKGIHAKPGTQEYKIIMRKIVWGEYPELNGDNSKFIQNPNEIDHVLEYAWKYSGYKELYGGGNEPFIKEAVPP